MTAKKTVCGLAGKGCEGSKGVIVCTPMKNPADFYCYGCKKFICDAHSLNLNMPWGGHDPMVHLDVTED